MSAIILHNDVVHYEVLGRGKPLLFIHSWSGSWRYWIPAMQAASISFRTYAIDLWGFGGSTKNLQYYSLSTQSILIQQFLDKMGVQKAAIISHGLGAAVATILAENSPERVDRIICVNPPSNQHIFSQELSTFPPSDLVNWLLNDSQDGEYAKLEAGMADRLAAHEAVESLKNVNIEQLISKIKIPCLLVYGENDPLLKILNLTKSSYPLPQNATEISFDQSGHFPMLDEPNKFNRLMLEFLNLKTTESINQLQLKKEWKRRIR
jgi:pimeloyl-ACP methyl ester carboxylesterase